MSRIGVTPETLVVFYGDKNNWWATYAFWVFQLFGHQQRQSHGRRTRQVGTRRSPDDPRTCRIPRRRPTRAPERNDDEIRAFRDQVLAHQQAGKPLIDVRSPAEYSGERLHMPDYPNEGALRGGHIPGAKNVPWSKAINPDDGTFKSAAELRALYEGEAGLVAG